MPEDIPEEPDQTTDSGPILEPPRSFIRINNPYTVDLIFAVVSAGFPFGYEMIGFPPNIFLGCACWAITLLAILDCFRRWSFNAGRFKKTRWLIISAIPILALTLAWHPVLNEYRLQHAPPKQPEFELYLNHKLVSNASIIGLKTSRKVFFQVRNIGDENASGLIINFSSPLDATNLIMDPRWLHVSEGQTVSNGEIHVLRGFNMWRLSCSDTILTNEIFSLTAFSITPTSPHPSFTVGQLKDFGFMGIGMTDFPSSTPIPFLPATVSIYSPESTSPRVYVIFMAY